MKDFRLVWLFTTYNMYESKRHFTFKLAEAFERLGVKTRVFTEKVWREWEPSQGERPDFTCSFHTIISASGERNVKVKGSVPHLFLLVDPIFYYMDFIAKSGMIVTCVDRTECEILHSLGFSDHVFFLPHGVEGGLGVAEDSERPYDVCLIGSCYDPETTKKEWEEKLPPLHCRIVEEAVEMAFANKEMPFFSAAAHCLQRHGVNVSKEELFEIGRYVDFYMRGTDRVELLRSIKDASIHIFGGTTSFEGLPGLDWGHYLGGQPNVTIHPAIPYQESLSVLMKSKIAINSSPTYKNGSHERVFAALACGAVPFTSESLFFREIFNDGEDLFFYQFSDRAAVNGKINDLLANGDKRTKIARTGREKVLKGHTWDNRAEAILRFMEERQSPQPEETL